MSAGGTLTIATRNVAGGSAGSPAARKGKDFVVLEVQDTGHGMTPETIDRAFEPFFTTKKAGEGTGLGLSQVHGTITQHGGYMGIESTAGKGTIVRMFLPRAKPGPPRRLAVTGSATRPMKSPKRILVVDDDHAVRASVTEMLQSLGHIVVDVASGRDGLRLLDNDSRFDLVLTDHAMPGMTGTDFAEWIRRSRPTLKVAIMTGNTEAVPVTTSVSAMIRKPFSRASLSEQLGL
jgi:CheY-like chemotaxis protein